MLPSSARLKEYWSKLGLRGASISFFPIGRFGASLFRRIKGADVMERVAIVGVGWSGFKPSTPEVSYKELTYEAAVKAYADAGVDPRRDVDSFVTVAEDFLEGTSIFDEYTPDQLGRGLQP